MDREKEDIRDECEWNGEVMGTCYPKKGHRYVCDGATKGTSCTRIDDWHDNIVRLGWRKEHGRDVGEEGDVASGVTAHCHASPGLASYIEGGLDVHCPLWLSG